MKKFYQPIVEPVLEDDEKEVVGGVTWQNEKTDQPHIQLACIGFH